VHDVGLVAGETAPFIAGVDPVSADRVYVRTVSKGPGRLLVSSDAGKTFTTAYTGGQLLGFALSPDGSEVYLGGPTDGLQIAPSSTMTFSQKTAMPVRCITASGASLYVCSDDASGPLVSRTDDDGSTFTPLLHLATFRGPLACPPGSSAANCTYLWTGPEGQEAVLGGEAAPGQCGGALPVDAGSAADAGAPSPAPSKGCGCGPSSGASLSAPGALVVAALAFLARTRRRR
jgi:MYXO-CTERM domain-containing protein